MGKAIHRSRRGFVLGRLALLLAAFAMTPLPDAAAQSEEKPSKEKDSGVTRLRVEVKGGEKPVESASVYVRYTRDRALGKDRKVEMNLKTNRDGVARVNNLPRGKVMIQVIAPGWKTFGRWYDLEEDEQTIHIKLEKPPRWY